MSKPMRKYEAAGGVVPLNWKAGRPGPGQAWGVIIAELWSVAWGPTRVGQVHHAARIVALRWKQHEGAGRWENLDGTPVSENLQWRRWAQLASRYRTTQLTLESWS